MRRRFALTPPGTPRSLCFVPPREDPYNDALKIAQMYYHHRMNTDEIASALGFSRAKVSRLLNHAREIGVVEVRIVDRRGQTDPLARDLTDRYRALETAVIVPVSTDSSAPERLRWVTDAAGAYLADDVFDDGMVVGLGSGETLALTARALPRRAYDGMKFVQLHGSTVAGPTGIGYIDGIMMRFAAACDGEVLVLPVPMLVGERETRELLWRDPAVNVALEYQQRADVFVFSIGLARLWWDHMVSHSLGGTDDHSIVGELAATFFRSDGSYHGIPLNSVTTGPPLELFRRVKRSVCVVSGEQKVPGLHSALEAGYVSDLIIDTYTAESLRAIDR